MNQIFNSSYTRHDFSQRARHGMRWTTEELLKMRTLFKSGSTLKEMCVELQRPADGVMKKLTDACLLVYVPSSGKYHYTETPHRFEGICQENLCKEIVLSTEPTLERIDMNDTAKTFPTIETKTFIRGRDASVLSDADIFRLIATLEGEIAAMESIANKPKKLLAAIAEIKTDIQSLVDYVDAR